MVKKPTEILEEEHRIIQKVVDAMAVLLERLEKGEDVKGETVKDIVDFMQVFGDKCHYGKEELHLFLLLGKKGVPMTGCPIAMLISEHSKSRSLVKQLSEVGTAYANGDRTVKSTLVRILQGLIAFHPNHIWKEEYLLFPMTNKVLNDEDQKELFNKFEAVEKEIGSDTRNKYEHMAERIREQVL